MRYAYFPGCVAKGACKELELSIRLVSEKLGIGLTELSAASCCGAGIFDQVNPKINMALNARTLAQAEMLGLDILTVCSTCYGVLSDVSKRLSDPKELEKANKSIKDVGYRYKGTVKVKHFLEILSKDYGLDRLSKEVRNPLTQIKPATMYGCHLRAQSPHMEDVIRTIGARPVQSDNRKRCCGFPILMINRKTSLKLAANVLLDAKEKGANCLVTACPLCHMNFDSIQPDIEKHIGKKIDLPILHLSQLVGLSLGIRMERLGLDKHVVPTDKLVRLVHL